MLSARRFVARKLLQQEVRTFTYHGSGLQNYQFNY
jgi:hypothetical protein